MERASQNELVDEGVWLHSNTGRFVQGRSLEWPAICLTAKNNMNRYNYNYIQ